MAMENKLSAARFFKHLNLIKCISQEGNVIGFRMNVQDFIKVVANGSIQQKRKVCVATQTSEEEFEDVNFDLSPSVFSKAFKKMRK